MRESRFLQDLDRPVDSARQHHYQFAHQHLPRLLWTGDAVLGILANPGNQDFLLEEWDKVREVVAKDGDPAVDPEGLSHESFWVGNAHLVFLIRLPQPRGYTEAHYVAITTSPEIRYLTFEMSFAGGVDETVYLCEWTRNMTHRSHQRWAASAASEDAFLWMVCRVLDVPTEVAAPLAVQQRGMSKGRMVLYGPEPEEMSPEDFQQLEAWRERAEAATDRGDFAVAEECYRHALRRAVEVVGLQSQIATFAMRDLAIVFELQGKLEASEELLRELWRVCRRFRHLGHVETISTIRAVAEARRGRGDVAGAHGLLRYAVDLAGLARGQDSPVAEHARRDLELFETATAST